MPIIFQHVDFDATTYYNWSINKLNQVFHYSQSLVSLHATINTSSDFDDTNDLDDTSDNVTNDFLSSNQENYSLTFNDFFWTRSNGQLNLWLCRCGPKMLLPPSQNKWSFFFEVMMAMKSDPKKQ